MLRQKLCASTADGISQVHWFYWQINIKVWFSFWSASTFEFWLCCWWLRDFTVYCWVFFCFNVNVLEHVMELSLPSGVLKKGWGPVDVFSTGWRQEAHLASKSRHQLPLVKYTFPALLMLFLGCHSFCSFLSGTYWDGVKLDVWIERELRW